MSKENGFGRIPARRECGRPQDLSSAPSRRGVARFRCGQRRRRRNVRGAQARFRAALRSKLPFETEVMICDGSDFLAWQARSPFGSAATEPNTVRFVSILPEGGRPKRAMPIILPADGDWLLRVVASRGRYLFGIYRRHMKTIGYLGQLDKVFGAPATTRNWNTIAAILAILKEVEKKR